MFNRIVPAVLSAIIVTTAAGAVFAAEPAKAPAADKAAVEKQCKLDHATDKAAYDACVKAAK